ncbi:MAG: hypothetical protein IKT42_04185 [Clostridia bacterium]|nr:hypothetical protein [Clostridia bacterium]
MKKTPTQRAIDSINRNIVNVLKTFGRASTEYESITADLSKFDIDYTFKKIPGITFGVPQVANTAKNRRRSSSVRAKQRRNIDIRRRKALYEKRIKAYEKRGADRFENIQAFIDLMSSYEEFKQRRYNPADKARELEEKYGINIEYDMGRAFNDEDYLSEREEFIRNAEILAQQGININDVSVEFKDGANWAIDDETGEVRYTWT